MSDFSTFWLAYPRHVAKRAAERAWAKLRPAPALVQTILADLERRKASAEAARVAGRWHPQWPYPTSYLRGERWLDEDEAAVGIYDGLAAFAREDE